MANSSYLAFLDSKHPVYLANEDGWEREERRFFGGDAVLDELVRFDDEVEDGDHHKARKATATYINFPKITASVFAGHLRRFAPAPDQGYNFGSLGEVHARHERMRSGPTPAELLWYNVDGVGNDGSQWPAWWDGVQERAMATGMRWIMVESPNRASDAPVAMADVFAGQRPYLLEFSPLDVTNWYARQGTLQWAIVRVPVAEPRVDAGTMTGQDAEPGYYLLVRAGYTGLGDDYAGGGWWLFDSEKNPVTDVDGAPMSGTWDLTQGQIPLFPFFAEQSKGTRELPSIARSMLMELGQIAVGLMNLTSARDFDAWDAAKSIIYMLGADAAAMNQVADQLRQGSRVVAVPTVPRTGDSDQLVQIHDASTGAVPAEVFKVIVEAKFAEAREIAARQAMSTPDSSGASKQAGFIEGKSPTLGLLAANRETAENTALYFYALRMGLTPDAMVAWPREFDLQPLIDDIDASISMLRLTGTKSPAAYAYLIEMGMKERRVWPNDPALAEEIRAELASPPAPTAPASFTDIFAAGASSAPTRTNGAAVAAAGGTAPKYAIGDRVRATVDHMPGMAGMEGAITEAHAGAPPYYAVLFDGETKPHKWLAENEVEPPGAARREPQMAGVSMGG